MAATTDARRPSPPHRVSDVPPVSEVPWIALGRGSRAADPGGAEPVRTWRVFGQLVAAAVVVLVVVAFLGLLASRRIAERESVNDAARRTDLVADVVVQPALQDGIATSEPAAARVPRRRSACARARRCGRAGQGLGCRRTDRVLRRDRGSSAGCSRSARRRPRCSPSPRPRPRSATSTARRTSYERGQGKLLEVYRPVWTPDGTALLFETYSRYDVVTERSTSLWRGFAGITLTSLLLLVVLMLRSSGRCRPAPARAAAARGPAAGRGRRLRRRATADRGDPARRRRPGAGGLVVRRSPAQPTASSGRALRSWPAPVREAAATVRASIRGLRSLLVDIYPASLQTSGLAAALERPRRRTGRSRGMDVQLDLPAAGRGRADGRAGAAGLPGRPGGAAQRARARARRRRARSRWTVTGDHVCS